jgi:DNA (cytosine-5)-methyltransferase 1
MTFKPLTESRGEELLTLYQAGFHAKTSALPEKEQELTENDQECGGRWQGLLARYDQNTHSLRTVQCSLLEDLNESLQTWPKWGSMRNGECFQQPMLEQTISENEFGSLEKVPNNLDFFHTPNTTGLDGGSNSRKALKKRMEQWPTPDANCGQRGTQPNWTPKRKSGHSAQYTINQAVRDKFPTPTAHNSKEGAYPAEFTRKTPTLATHAGGKLNPMWVEWLMGWPLGWTDLKQLGTDKCRFVQQQPGTSLKED